MTGAVLSSLRALRSPGIRRDLGTTTISNLITLAAAGSTGIVIARALGPASRGEYAAIMAWFGLMLIVGEFGQTASITYYVSRGRDQAKDYVATSRALIVACGALTIGAGVAVAPWLASGSSTLLSGYQLMFVACLASFVGATYVFSLQATNILKWNLVRVSQPAMFMAGVGVLLATGCLTLLSALTVFAVTIAIQAALSYWVCWHNGLTGGRTDRTLARPLTRYGLSHAAAALPSALVARLDILVLSFAVTASAVGQYAVATSLTSLAVPLATAIGSVAFPRIASRGQSTDSRRLQRWAVSVSLILATGIMLPLACVAHWIVPAVFGQAYSGAVPVVMILAPGGVFLSCGRVCEDLLRGYGRPLTVARVQLSVAVLAAILLAALVPPFGVIGAAAASSVAAGTSLLLLMRSLRHTNGKHEAGNGGSAPLSIPRHPATSASTTGQASSSRPVHLPAIDRTFARQVQNRLSLIVARPA